MEAWGRRGDMGAKGGGWRQTGFSGGKRGSQSGWWRFFRNFGDFWRLAFGAGNWRVVWLHGGLRRKVRIEKESGGIRQRIIWRGGLWK